MSGSARATRIIGILSYTYTVSKLRAEGEGCDGGNEAVARDLRYSSFWRNLKIVPRGRKVIKGIGNK
jgi:hypothetical protein